MSNRTSALRSVAAAAALFVAFAALADAQQCSPQRSECGGLDIDSDAVMTDGHYPRWNAGTGKYEDGGSTVGSPGPTGPTGPQGPPGEDGADGAPGADGADGLSAYELAQDEGFIGTIEEWLESLIGPQGPAGNDGADGADGAAGPTGPQGPAGPTGPTGPAGADGADGADGAAGPAGPTGPTGPTGPQGPAGADGDDGVCAFSTVQDEGIDLTQRPKINFTGPNISCADDSGNARTNCTTTDDDAPECGDLPAHTGDVTSSAGSCALTIANDAVTNAKLRNSGALSVIGRSANSSGDPADISCTAASGGVLRESGSTIGCGQIATAGIADNAVDNTKLRNSGALSVIGQAANAAGDPADISCTPGGGGVLRESGSTLGCAVLATANIGDNQVTNAKLRDSGALSVIGRSANSTGDPADISCTAGAGGVLRESGSTVGCGTVATAGIANDAVTLAKIENFPSLSVMANPNLSTGDAQFFSAPGTGMVFAYSATNGMDWQPIYQVSPIHYTYLSSFSTSSNTTTGAGGTAVTHTILAGTLDTQGDTVEVSIRFNTAANGSGGKRITIAAFGTTLYDSGSYASNNEHCHFTARIARFTSATTAKARWEVYCAGGAREGLGLADLTPANLGTNSNAITATLIGTTNLADMNVTEFVTIIQPT